MTVAIAHPYSSAQFYHDNRKAMLGVAGAFCAFGVDHVATMVEKSLEAAGKIKPDDLQDVVQLLNGINNIPNVLLKVAAKTAAVAYVTIIGPVLEEWMFREVFHEGLVRFTASIWGPNTNDTIQVVCRVFSNGILFGAAHLLPFQGWANVPIFVATALMGMVFAALREYTGDCQASCIAHMVNNTVVLKILKFI
ncbi:hypothetical protein COB11_06150 [Candidatus Aerophobetes bacterium]|uniref:CAAX prenyl protease 2/Lysostaphin resistance protein A-like domain-containing protein n=1 Tax=Aerophobetes bacterium TaxID=2030807 RepID=A0A2A4YF99_UNCAE|nr:MAG: hypothetical protein COB11_06150 [Candidatus Aerophobetes bacterium]